jgi:hypothetical protein
MKVRHSRNVLTKTPRNSKHWENENGMQISVMHIIFTIDLSVIKEDTFKQKIKED